MIIRNDNTKQNRMWAFLASGTLYLLGDAGTEVTSGFCSQMRVYNRVLNPYEIAENFQATRGRFGI
jgi:hypothetical protein